MKEVRKLMQGPRGSKMWSKLGTQGKDGHGRAGREGLWERGGSGRVQASVGGGWWPPYPKIEITI